jgi:ketosteroid isomerase-like protein
VLTPGGGAQWQAIPLEIRLTMGFRKRNRRWIVHEHHSVLATD